MTVSTVSNVVCFNNYIEIILDNKIRYTMDKKKIRVGRARAGIRKFLTKKARARSRKKIAALLLLNMVLFNKNKYDYFPI